MAGSIGSISASLSLNIGNFVKNIKRANEELSKFNKKAKTVGLGGLRKGARKAKKPMVRLGRSAAGVRSQMVPLGRTSNQVASRMSTMGGAVMMTSSRMAPLMSTSSRITSSLRGTGVAAVATRKRMAPLRATTGQINKSLGKTSGIISGTGSQMKSSGRKMNNSLGSVMKKTMNLKRIFAMTMHYLTFTIGVQAIMQLGNAVRSIIDTLSDFRHSAVMTASVTGYLGSSLEGMSEQVAAVGERLGATTIFMATEATESMYSLASAGFDLAGSVENVKEGVETLSPFMHYAAATGAELAEATEAVSKALKMFDKDLTNAKEVVDVFTGAITNSFMTFDRLQKGMQYVGAIAGSLGVTLEDTTAALASLTDAGMSGSQSGRRLRMIFTKLIDPTKKGKKALEKLGVSMEALDPKTHSLSEIFLTLQAAGYGATEAAKMFRGATAGAAATLVKNASSISYYNRQFRASVGVTKELAMAQRETLWGALKLLTAKIEQAGIELGKSLKPQMLAVINAIQTVFVPAVKGLAGAFKALNAAWRDANPLLSALVGILGTYVTLATAAKIVTWAWNASLFANIAAQISSIHTNQAWIMWVEQSRLATLSAEAATWSWNAALLASPITWIVMAIGGLIAVVLALAKHFGMLEGFVEGLNARISDFIDWLQTAWTVIMNVVPGLKAFADAIGGVVDAVADWWTVSQSEAKAQKELEDSLDKVTKGTKKYINQEQKLTNLKKEKQNIEKQLAKERGKEKKDTQKINKLKGKLVERNQEITDARKELNEIESPWGRFKVALKDVHSAYEKELQAEKNLREVQEDENTTAEELANKKEALEDANSKLTKAQGELQTSIALVAKKMKETSEAVADSITNYQDLMDLQQRIHGQQEKLNDIRDKSKEAQKDYNEAVREYGSASDEAQKAMEDLMDLRDREEKGLGKISDLEGKVAETRKKLEKNAKKRHKSGTKLFKLYKNMREVQQSYNQAIDTRNKLQAKNAVLTNTRIKYEKYFQERVKKLREAQEKYYEVELKLYKLRHSQVSVLKNLFEKLAAEGALTEEIIEKYKEMMQAQGEMRNEYQDYMKVLSDMTDENREKVTEWTEAYIEGMDKGMSKQEAMAYATDEVGYALTSIVSKSSDAYAEIIEYGNAAHKSHEETEEFREAIVDLGEDLKEAGQLSAGAAEALQEVLDMISDLNSASDKEEDKQKKINAAWGDSIRLASRLFYAYDNMNEYAGDTTAIIKKMAETMGLWNGEATKQSTILSKLRSFYGRANAELGDFTDAEIAAALNAYDMADAYEKVPKDITLPELGDYFEIDKEKYMSEVNSVFTTIGNGFDGVREDLKDIKQTISKTFLDLKYMMQVAAEDGYEAWSKQADITQIFKDWRDAMGYTAEEGKNHYSEFIQWIYSNFPSKVSTKLALDFSDAYSDVTDYKSNIKSLLTWLNKREFKFEMKETISAPQFVSKWENHTKDLEDFVNNKLNPKMDIEAELEEQGWVVSKKKGGFAPGENLGLIQNIFNKPENITTLPIEYEITGGPSDGGNGKGDGGIDWMQEIKTFLLGGPSAVARRTGGILGLQEGIKETKGPQFSLIGEEGAEAVVPLEGVNKKYGLDILQTIIPRHFPKLSSSIPSMQFGGTVGATMNTYNQDERFNIMGPVNVQTDNVEDFIDKLKYRSRASAAGGSKRL